MKIEKKKTLVGVPQELLSPILFSVFIKDIPTASEKKIYISLLFAEDLATSFIFKDTQNITEEVKTYLRIPESWNNKWRLSFVSKNVTSY